ncbi:hypothetical protein HDU89_008896 [Geranomyces variabilis]|nr:hypothetical protein HDU89_008896 [Geranomyces variabilis]
MLKSANDSLTFAFPAGVPIFANSSEIVTFTVDGRDKLINRVKNAYSATYFVIYRNFYVSPTKSSSSGLLRRDASGDTLFLKFSLADLVTGTFLDYLQLAKASTIFTQTLATPYRTGITTTTGDLANTTLKSAGSILVIILVATWQRVEAPTPQLTYLGGKRFWSCGGTPQTQNRFVICLICLSGTLLLAACKLSYDTLKVGWPVRALEDKIIFGNAANILVTGVAAAGILMGLNMMDGIAQFALRVTAVYLVGAGLTVTLLGYKVFLLMRPAENEEDAVDARVRQFAAKSAKSGSIYQNSKYLPVKAESALIWKAAQITIAQSLLDVTDLDSKVGRFYAILSVDVDTDIPSNCLLLRLPGSEQLRVQMDSQRMLEDWVKKIADAKSKAPATKTDVLVPATVKTPLLNATMEEDT